MWSRGSLHSNLGAGRAMLMRTVRFLQRADWLISTMPAIPAPPFLNGAAAIC
jgi:hypothetical protein